MSAMSGVTLHFCLIIISAGQIGSTFISCISNVTFVSPTASTVRSSSTLNECFCWIARESSSGANFFSNNNTCELFDNFTTNYQLISNSNIHFCFTSQPPALVTSTTTSTTPSLQWNSTGVTVATGNGNSSVLSPYGVFVDDQYYIYIAEKTTSRVSKWPPNPTGGSSSPVFQTGGSQLNQPPSLYVDSATGTIYVADESSRRVRIFLNGSTTGSNVTSTTVGSAPNVNAIFLDPNGTIFVTDSANHRIYNWLTNATAAGGNGAGANASQLNGPRRFFIDEEFSFYIPDNNNHRVQKWARGASTGETVAGGNAAGNSSNQLFGPVAVVVSSQGDVIVCDGGNNRIQLWRPNATIGETIAGSPNGTTGATATLLNAPRGLAIDKSDNIYVVDNNNLRIQKFNAF